MTSGLTHTASTADRYSSTTPRPSGRASQCPTSGVHDGTVTGATSGRALPSELPDVEWALPMCIKTGAKGRGAGRKITCLFPGLGSSTTVKSSRELTPWPSFPPLSSFSPACTSPRRSAMATTASLIATALTAVCGRPCLPPATLPTALQPRHGTSRHTYPPEPHGTLSPSRRRLHRPSHAEQMWTRCTPHDGTAVMPLQCATRGRRQRQRHRRSATTTSPAWIRPLQFGAARVLSAVGRLMCQRYPRQYTRTRSRQTRLTRRRRHRRERRRQWATARTAGRAMTRSDCVTAMPRAAAAVAVAVLAAMAAGSSLAVTHWGSSSSSCGVVWRHRQARGRRTASTGRA